MNPQPYPLFVMDTRTKKRGLVVGWSTDLSRHGSPLPYVVWTGESGVDAPDELGFLKYEIPR